MKKRGDRTYCRYPECEKHAGDTFALVPLCLKHKALIEDETAWYYDPFKVGVAYKRRIHYLKIAHLIPWSQVSTGKVRADGSVSGNRPEQ